LQAPGAGSSSATRTKTAGLCGANAGGPVDSNSNQQTARQARLVPGGPPIHQRKQRGQLMAAYRHIHVTFWSDPFILELTPEEKYFYLYLMTNPHTTQCGVYELPSRIIELETGYNRETIAKLLNRFEGYGKIKYDDKTTEVFLVNWLKFNLTSSPKVIGCIRRELENVKNDGFRRQISRQLTEKEKKKDRVSIGYGYGIDTLSQEKEKEKEKKESSRPKLTFTDDDMKAAKWMFSRIQKLNSSAKQPNFERWANDIRLMRDVDGKDHKAVCELFKWANEHDFWQRNILSPGKLREKWDQLTMQSLESKPGKAAAKSALKDLMDGAV
jgi:hypothetical protein